MNDDRLDGLLAACDPLDVGLLKDLEADMSTDEARSRMSSARAPRHRAIGRVALGALGFAAIGALIFALLLAAPGDDLEPAGPASDSGLIEPSSRVPAPSFSLPVIVAGERSDVGWAYPRAAPEAARPHPLVISFTDEWCEPCQPDLATLQELWETTAVGDLAVLGVAGPLDGRATEVESWWTTSGATFPLAVDTDGAVRRFLAITGQPVTILVDRKGRIAQRFEGTLEPSSIRQAVEALLAEPVTPEPPSSALIRGPVPPGALALSVFDLPMPTRRPPAGLTTLTGGVYEQSLRLALRSPSGIEVWVARGPDDHVILATTGPTGSFGYGADAAADLGRRAGVFMGGQDGPGQPWYMSGLVADGYTMASGGGRSTPIRNNVFLFEGGTPFTAITITGPAGTRLLR
jgi:peroxiredoxin